MTRRLLLILLSVLLAAAAAAERKTRVREYTRKDGTVVHAHERSVPSRSAPSKPAPAPKAAPTPPARDPNGRIARSTSAKHAFQAAHPCPATRATSGACPGYVIDHITPLACGGPDSPSNMQWQTAAQAKEKDRWERNGCQVH